MFVCSYVFGHSLRLMFDHDRMKAVRNSAFGMFGMIMFGHVFVVFGRLVFGVRKFCVRGKITSVCSKVC